jgi:hypothetical protein
MMRSGIAGGTGRVEGTAGVLTRAGLAVALLAGLVAGAARGQVTVEKIEPIENNGLTDAIRKYQAEPNEANEAQLAAFLQKASYVIPVRDAGMQTADEQGGRVTIKKGSKILFATYRGSDGASYLPLHTSSEAIQKWLEEDNRTLVLAAPQVWDLILANADWSGAVVDPGSTGFVLGRPSIQKLKEGATPGKQAVVAVPQR